VPFGALVSPREAVALGRNFAGPVGGEDGVGGGALFFRGALAGGGGVVPLGRVGEGLAGRGGPGGEGSLRMVGVGLTKKELMTPYVVCFAIASPHVLKRLECTPLMEDSRTKMTD
jgi:hypothetical protein